MGTINIQSTDLSHKAGLTYTGTSDKTIDVNNVLQTSDTTASIASGKVVVDSSGNVGIGTNSPSYKLDIVNGRASITGNSDQYSLQLRYNSSTNGCWLGSPTTDSFAVYTAGGGERMRIDSSGNLLVGTTALPSAAGGNYGAALTKVPSGSSSTGRLIIGHGDSTGARLAAFFYGTTPTTIGSIDASTTNVSYNTSSDYRLKEDYQDMIGATDRLKALKPINFAWKIDGSRVDGFLAHELQEVVPEAATGTKDAMREEEYIDENGNTQTREVPDYQGIDQSKLVPLLTKALQEAVERIEQLEARIEALEAK